MGSSLWVIHTVVTKLGMQEILCCLSDLDVESKSLNVRFVCLMKFNILDLRE